MEMSGQLHDPARRASLDLMEKRNVLPLPGIESRLSSPKPIAIPTGLYHCECVSFILVGKHEGNKLLGMPRSRQEDNIKIILKEIESVDVG
jgi:hypothetical protein